MRKTQLDEKLFFCENEDFIFVLWRKLWVALKIANCVANSLQLFFQIYMTQAKKLKHEADKESNNRERQAMKYLEAVLFFILCGSTTETRGDHAAAYTMYKETLNLVQHVTRVGRYVFLQKKKKKMVKIEFT